MNSLGRICSNDLADNALLEFSAVGYEPAEIFGHLRKLIIDHMKLFIRPLKPAGPDKS
jgi:hypothetical protein